MKINTLIVGLGNIGLLYDYELSKSKYITSHANAVFSNKGFNIISGIDPSREGREKFKKKFNIEAYESINAFTFHKHVDLIIISVPTELHLEVFKEVIKKFAPKIILIEKPCGLNLDQALEIKKLAKTKKIKVLVNYIRRSEPSIIKLKNFFDENNFYPFKGNLYYTKGLKNNASHFLDLFQFFFGQIIKIENIKNFSSVKKNDMLIDCKLIFKNGEISLNYLWEDIFTYNSFEIFSPSGKVLYEDSSKITIFKPYKDKKFKGYKILQPQLEIKNYMDIYQKNVLSEILKEFNHSKTNMCTIDQALTTHKVINKISESL